MGEQAEAEEKATCRELTMEIPVAHPRVDQMALKPFWLWYVKESQN